MPPKKDGKILKKITYVEGGKTYEIWLQQIGPETAQAYLDTNQNFRNMNLRRVQRYLKDMKSNLWKFNGASIVLDIYGRLVDGQHRLTAIIESGKICTFLVVKGIGKAEDSTIDTGKKRTVPDYLRYMGLKNPVGLAMALKIIYRQEKGERWDLNRNEFTTQEALPVLKKHPVLQEWLKAASGCITLKVSVPVVASYLYLMSFQDSELAEDFLVAIRDGENLKKTDPVWKFRSWCMRHANDRYDKKPTAAHYAALLVKCWNAWRENREIKHLSWCCVGPNAEDFPEIL